MVEPDQLRFSYGPFGKPELSEKSEGDWLRFNLTHSHGLALYAFSNQRELGVDIEHIDAKIAIEEIAERFFTRWEAESLRKIPENWQPKAFYSCWTRKEAYLKAKGTGLSMPMDRFEVSLAPGQSAALLSCDGDPEETSRWSLWDLEPRPDYAAALCAEGSGGLELLSVPEDWFI